MWTRRLSIAPSDRVFVLTGAGISAESGLPTFRASDGLWAGHRVEDVCTPDALELNPELVWQFYSERRAQGAKASRIRRTLRWPSLKRSSAIASFSARKMWTTCTSAPVRCGWCTCMASWRNPAASMSAAGRPLKITPSTRAWTKWGAARAARRLRPHIVFFGEIPLEMERIQR